MLTFKGAPYRLCNGMTRRDLLRVGGYGIAGFSLADLLQLRAEAAPTKGKATSIIMIHLGGGPSQLDTYDPKPDAPVEYRGEFKAMPTKVDGVQICELLPKHGAMMDRLAIVRSISGVPEEHSSSHNVTGYGNNERILLGDKPAIGSVLARLKAKPDSLVPPYVSLRGLNRESGLGSAYLGGSCEPLVYDGPGRDDLKLHITDKRLAGRRRMLDQVDSFRRTVDMRTVKNQDAFSQKALEIVSSPETYNAMDLSKETAETRKRYGNDQLLLARRLVESGVRSVALEIGGWDTHSDNFKSLKDLLPKLDQGFSALMTDLKERGLEEQTVVVMWGEFGRTPKVNGTAGRDHWPRVMSALIAGGGLKMGQAIGTTDATASDAAEDPFKMRNVVATLYHALGIDPKTMFTDMDGRPVPLIHDADPIPQLIA